MAQREVYVDPSIDDDSGSGTIGTPYGDLVYAIKQTAEIAGTPTRFNVKAGTAEVLAAQLATAFADTSVTAAWSASQQEPVTIQGYTAVAGDGGKCVLDGDGAASIIEDTGRTVNFVDCVLQNCGDRYTLRMGSYAFLALCHIIHDATSSGNNAVHLQPYSRMYGCLVRVTAGGSGVIGVVASSSEVVGCVVDLTGANANTVGLQGAISPLLHNLVIADKAHGIQLISSTDCINNAVYADASTGIGVDVRTFRTAGVRNNLVEGFSGVGGIGFRFDSQTAYFAHYAGANGVYNCTTPYQGLSDQVLLDLGDNEILTESPFVDAANGDFTPVDTGNVLRGALPQVIGGGFVGSNPIVLAKGAVQPDFSEVEVLPIKPIDIGARIRARSPDSGRIRIR